MANPQAQLVPIEIPPGVTPITDDTLYAAQNFTAAQGIRFRNGRPEKKGGYSAFTYDNGAQPTGTTRSEYSTEINGIFYTLIGTSSRLYVLIDSVLTNITPFQTTPVAASNSLSTLYGTLGSNPFSVKNGSNIVTVTDSSASRFRVGDIVTFSGASSTGGISNTTLNAEQTILTIGTGNYTFVAATAATSTTTGGGASVVRATGLINLSITNTLAEGDRIKIAGASNTGGIIASTFINAEFIARNVSGSSFDFFTGGTATSSVAAAGGTGTEYYPPIPAGNTDESYGNGYGAGNYGVGLYGTDLTSDSAREYPQIWFFDRFGDFIMMTPGNQGALYEWSGSTETAPVITANSPSNINYMFVTENTVVVFGNGAEENRITACDQGNRTVWSGTATNQFFDGVQSGAGRFIGHINLDGISLIFTEKQVYTFQQIGLPNVWKIDLVANVGMISALSGWEINGVGYWMGLENFYFWGGGEVTVVPSNIFPQSTMVKYVFDNLNFAQKSKAFCWFNRMYQEWRIHYPSANSNECDSVVVCNMLDSSWWPDVETRSCAERPAYIESNPRLLDINGNMYIHEIGTDNLTQPLPFYVATNLRSASKNEVLLSSFVPDSTQTGGAINVEITAWQWPNSAMTRSQNTYRVPVNGGRQNFGQQGRFWQYEISGNVLGQSWRMGTWGEERQIGSDGA